MTLLSKSISQCVSVDRGPMMQSVVNTWNIKNEGNLHAEDLYIVSYQFQVDLLLGLHLKIFNAMQDRAQEMKVDFWDDSCISFAEDGFPVWRKVALCVADEESGECTEYFFRFNSAGSFIVDSASHPLDNHPLVSAAYQVCVERRCCLITDWELISSMHTDPDILQVVKERKG